ncbi:MAG TPA: cation:proton antiporter [Mycobacteriales bacterium]|nr:cation:proton antiporter [Mycobacteriales bacterium]
MTGDFTAFALIVLIVAAVGSVAIASSRLSAWLRVPAPFLFLAGAAIVVKLAPSLHPPHQTVERVVTVALAVILFDGGLHIGWRRFRSSAALILVLGIAGTALTTAGAAVLGHFGFGFAWYAAVLLATAIAPTDPAVVFSVLGGKEIGGPSGTLLEGESGANDPVGIALMASLISAGGLSAGAFGQVVGTFLLQLAVGAAVGAAGGWLLQWAIRRLPLPNEGLYPLRTLAAALLLYGIAGVAHGSGFLAVFLAGIVLGDAEAPFKREVERFHASLSSLAEIVAFVVLGLTVNLNTLGELRVWLPGVVIAAVLAAVIRPLIAAACLVGSRLHLRERTFVALVGLKGAVPILLGTLLLTAHVADRQRLYGIVVVVVGFSVLIQGSLVPLLVRRLRLVLRA